MRREAIYLFVFFITFTLLIGCQSSGPKTSGPDIPVDTGDLDDIEPVTLAVFYFNSTQEDLRSITLDTLIVEFSRMQEFRVVERERLDTVLEELGLSASDLVDEAVRVKVGGILGAHLMCFGSIFESSGQVRMVGYLTRVETSEILGGATAEEKGELKAIGAFAEQIKAQVRTEKIHQVIEEISEGLRST